jgi:protein O-GlcNAc transferase
MTVDQAINEAMDCVEAGRLNAAASICQQVLQVVPHEHRAVRLLGAVALKSGQPEQASRLFRQAVSMAPGQIEYYDNLCSALIAQQHWSELEQAARHMLQLAPGYARAENSLGLALKEQGHATDAEAAFHRALSLDPRSMQALSNLGNLLRTLGRWSEAEQVCRAAVSLAPHVAGTHLNLGAVLHEQQKHEAAIAAFDQALALDPQLALAAFNRGASQEAACRFTEAEASYRIALERQPDMLTAENNLGNTLKYQGRLFEAIDCFRRALSQRPGYMVAHTNLLLAMQCDPNVTPEELLREHREWNARHAVPLAGLSSTSLASSRRSRGVSNVAEPVRVGFVSPDLGTHPVGRFLIAAFENLDRSKVATFCYSDRKHPDVITDRFKAAATVWRETRLLTDEQLVEQIRADELDLLIDLTGHTGHHRLLVFARKPAPVQASWLGYAGTTGIDTIDWLIADPFLIPPSKSHYYSEGILTLPSCHVCFEPPTFEPPTFEPQPFEPQPFAATPFAVPVAESPFKRNGFVTFGSFNKPDKTTSDVIAVWSQILARVPDSRLVLRNRGLDDKQLADLFIRQFESNGLSRERVELHGWATHEELLGHWSNIDIALDTFPFSGLATSADALWMGVPIVTLIGESFASRQTGSLLTSIGETSTIATDRDEYINHAVELANDPARFQSLRDRLRPAFAASPLCDAAALARDLEQAFNLAINQAGTC